MARIVKAPDIRRQELISIALSQFIKHGYEKTSVRSILNEAGGEIGMFYHYFKSKNEIYEAALEKYNAAFIDNLDRFAQAPDLSFQDKLLKIFSCVSDSISEYRRMASQKANPDIMTLLHSRTLLKLEPMVETLLADGLKREEAVGKPIENTHLLSRFILYGVSAVIHDSEVSSMEEKTRSIKALINKLLEQKPEGEGAV